MHLFQVMAEAEPGGGGVSREMVYGRMSGILKGEKVAKVQRKLVVVGAVVNVIVVSVKKNRLQNLHLPKPTSTSAKNHTDRRTRGPSNN